MAKQVLYVNGKAVTPRSTTRRNTILITLLIGWCVFITYSYIQLKTNVSMNTGSIANILCDDNAEYMNRLSHRESSGDWKIVGGYNNSYVGLYQFGNSALRDIDSDIRVRDFKRDPNCFPPEKQNEACVALMRKNAHYLRNYMYVVGDTINGIEVSKAGLLAAAHLVGHTNVKRWIRSNGDNDSVDGFGTSLEEYVKMMEGVQVNL